MESSALAPTDSDSGASLGRIRDWRGALQLAGAPSPSSLTAENAQGDGERFANLPTQFVVDAKRAFHFDVCSHWGSESEERTEASYRLARVLDQAFHSSASASSSSHTKQTHHYYQGLHDIASVLLLASNSNEVESLTLLQALMKCHLAPFTSTTMATTVKLLDVAWRLLEIADRPLHHHLETSGIAGTPVFALSWLITWLSHDLRCFSNIAKVFDELIPGHPLLIVYVIVALMHSERDFIINVLSAEDPAPLFAALKRLPQRIAGEEGLHGDNENRLGNSARKPSPREEEVDTKAGVIADVDVQGATPRPTSRSTESAGSSSSRSAVSTAGKRRRGTPQTDLVKRGPLSFTTGGVTARSTTSITPLLALAKLMFRLCPPFVLLASSPATGFGSADWPMLAPCIVTKKGPQAGRCRSHFTPLDCAHSSSLVQLVDPSLRLVLENGANNVNAGLSASAGPRSPSAASPSAAKTFHFFSPKSWLRSAFSNPAALLLLGSSVAVVVIGIGLALQRQAMFRRYSSMQQQLVNLHHQHPCLLEAPEWAVSLFRGSDGGGSGDSTGSLGGDLLFLPRSGESSAGSDSGKALLQELKILGAAFSYLLSESFEAIKTAARDWKVLLEPVLDAGSALVHSVNPAARGQALLKSEL